jgi:hypothetical protein
MERRLLPKLVTRISTSTMMTAQRRISLRRKPQESSQRLTPSSRTIHSVEKGKLVEANLAVCRMHERVIKFSRLQAAVCFTTLVPRWSCWHRCNLYEFPITTGPKEFRLGVCRLPEKWLAGLPPFQTTINISDIPSYGGIILEMLDKEHFRREIKFPESESTSQSLGKPWSL